MIRVKNFHFKTRLFLFTVLIVPALFFLIKVDAAAQTYSASPEFSMTEDAAQGIINVTSSIIADSFTPMTHYNEEDWTTTLVPAYFKIKKLYDDRDLQGDNLKGYYLGFGGGYAINNRLIVYGALAYLKIDGTIYSRDYPDYQADTAFNMLALSTGLGFDLVESDTWSIPVYLGVCLQKYDAEITPPLFPDTYNYTVTVTGSGILYGPTAAIAVSREFFNRLRITPYFLMLWNMNKPELTAETTTQLPFPPYNMKYSYEMEVQTNRARMVGLNITLKSNSPFSFSLSAGGLLTSSTRYYNNKFLNGLEMMSIVAAISYSGN